MNFSFLLHKTTKLVPQTIMVTSSKVSWPLLLAVLSIARTMFEMIQRICRKLPLFKNSYILLIDVHNFE